MAKNSVKSDKRTNEIAKLNVIAKIIINISMIIGIRVGLKTSIWLDEIENNIKLQIDVTKDLDEICKIG